MKVVIPIHADVICLDGDAGTSKALIVEPVQRRLTHVVVREHRFADSERLVSIGLVDETSEGTIWLRCTRDELHGLDDFIDAHFIDLYACFRAHSIGDLETLQNFAQSCASQLMGPDSGKFRAGL